MGLGEIESVTLEGARLRRIRICNRRWTVVQRHSSQKEK